MGGADIVIDGDPPGAASLDVEKIDHLYHSSTVLHSSTLTGLGTVETAAWRLYSLCVNRTPQDHVADAIVADTASCGRRDFVLLMLHARTPRCCS